MSVSATPASPESVAVALGTNVKVAPSDIILFDEDASVIGRINQDIVFEDLFGQELISLLRNDTVNGQRVDYRPTKMLSSLFVQYGLESLISLQNTSETYFNNFPIRLSDYLAEVGTGPNGESVYIDSETGNLIINVIDLPSDYRVEVEILDSGKILDDTIY
jgi:hypothetical protein